MCVAVVLFVAPAFVAQNAQVATGQFRLQVEISKNGTVVAQPGLRLEAGSAGTIALNKEPTFTLTREPARRLTFLGFSGMNRMHHEGFQSPVRCRCLRRAVFSPARNPSPGLDRVARWCFHRVARIVNAKGTSDTPREDRFRRPDGRGSGRVGRGD